MIVCENPDFRSLSASIAALFAAASQSSFYAQATWYDLVARLGAPAGMSIRLYLDAATPRAGFVCCTTRRGSLQGLENFYTLEHGPLLAGADPAVCAAASGLATAIARENRGWHAIDFNACDPTDPSFAATRAGLRAAGWLVKPYFHFGTWYEDTHTLDFRTYLEARPARLRNTARRKEKQAEGLRYVFAEPGCDLTRLIEDYDIVYRNSWKGGEPFPHFMPALIRLADAQGALRMGVAYVDGVPAAAQFWLVHHGRATIYKLAHDDRYSRMSLGTLLTMRMTERVLDTDRPHEIDFGRGDDDYKRDWLPKRRERWGLFAVNPRTVQGLYRSALMVASRIRDRFRNSPAREA